MGYCDIAEAKRILQITENTWDYELDAILPTADALVDGLLKQEGLTVPGTVPQLLRAASARAVVQDKQFRPRSGFTNG